MTKGNRRVVLGNRKRQRQRKIRITKNRELSRLLFDIKWEADRKEGKKKILRGRSDRDKYLLRNYVEKLLHESFFKYRDIYNYLHHHHLEEILIKYFLFNIS